MATDYFDLYGLIDASTKGGNLHPKPPPFIRLNL